MRASRVPIWGLWILLAAALAPAAVVDRIAVVVGKTVITESELLQEVRLTEFLNQEPLNLGPEKRRQAADRLVDQQLIRHEMEIGRYPAPSPEQTDNMLRKFREEHYPSDAEFQAAMRKYGVTQDQLKQEFQWQLAAMRFTDQRFGAGLPDVEAPATAGSTGAANRTEPAADTANRAEPASDSSNVDQQMEAWLKQARTTTRIQFKKEAFQ